MKFTEKEMSLARQLKEDGLIWHPQEGDYFIAKNGNTVWICLGEINTEVIHFYNGYADHKWQAICDTKKQDVTWLPFWNQCREILDGLGIRITLGLSSGTGHRIIDFYRRERDNNKFLFTTRGGTDLEALYQGIGLLLVGGTNENCHS